MLWIIVGVVIVLVIWVVSIFNKLVGMKNRLKNAWSDIDVQLKRRYDLVPNLVETVRGYKDHEESTLTKVTEARNMAMAVRPGDLKAQAEAEGILSGALKSLFAVSESYPDLKASENFMSLQNKLSELEESISSARRYYNANVREFNTSTQVFPNNLFAGMFGFTAESFFGIEDASQKEPVKVDFKNN